MPRLGATPSGLIPARAVAGPPSGPRSGRSGSRSAALALLLFFLAAGPGPADPRRLPETATPALLDELFSRAMADNYRQEGRRAMADCLEACRRSLAQDPGDYELCWRAARAAVGLAECAKILNAPDATVLAGRLADEALAWCEAAILSEPSRVEAYFWHAQAAGLVFDSGGLGAVIARGLPATTRRDIEACLALEPSYLDYSALLACAMYYYNLPALWGRDMQKALGYYDRFAASTLWSFEPYRQRLQAAELLLAAKDARRQAEARAHLAAALADPRPRAHYYELAKKLLVDAEGGAGR